MTSNDIKRRFVDRCLRTAGVAALAMGSAGATDAAVVDFRTVPLSVDSNSVSFAVDGVAVTATGHHAEYDAASATATIYGPFPTGTAVSTPSFLVPGFGPTVQLGLIGQPNTVVSGLGLQASDDLGQVDNDLFQGGFQPGLDNAPCGPNTSALGCTGGVPPSIQFALFSFDVPVDVSEVTVAGVTTFGRSIWAAGGTTAPDLSQDLLAAFANFDVRNSPDDGSTGFFTHSIAPLQGVSYLAIGTPPDAGLIGDLGPIAGGAANIQFYVEGLDFTPVPLPAAGWLLGAALAALGTAATRRGRWGRT